MSQFSILNFQFSIFNSAPFRLALLGLCLLTPAARAAEPVAPTLEGTWRWNFVMPDGTTNRPKLKFSVEDGQLSGTTSFRSGTQAPVTNLVVNGDQISFQVIRQRNGEDIVTAYSGKWSDKIIKGKIESNWAGDKQTFAWVAERAHFGVEGVWRWTNSFFAGRGGGGGGGAGGRGRGRGNDSRVELEQEGEKLTGKTVGNRFGRPSPISNGSITNGEVYFEIERTFGEIKTVTKFRGKQTGDTIKGTMEAEFEGEERVIDWDAERVD
jgi:hypothetical protein